MTTGVAPVDDPGPAALRPARPAARRYDGRRVAIVLGVVLVLGTVALTAAATYFHAIGAVARERYEAAGRR